MKKSWTKVGIELIHRTPTSPTGWRWKIFDYWEEMNVSTNIGNWTKGTKTDLKGFQSYYRALATKTNEFPVAPQMQSPAADVLLALSNFDANIEELRKAAALPYSRFPLDYTTDPPVEILSPQMSAFKKCNAVLETSRRCGITKQPERQGTGGCEADVAAE